LRSSLRRIVRHDRPNLLALARLLTCRSYNSRNPKQICQRKLAGKSKSRPNV
jgi:hypothetical protein